MHCKIPVTYLWRQRVLVQLSAADLGHCQETWLGDCSAGPYCVIAAQVRHSNAKFETLSVFLALSRL